LSGSPPSVTAATERGHKGPKKFENHAHMVGIYAVWYNWIRIHKTLRVTPAIAAGLSKTVMDWSDLR
jgi:hypothetical protein